MAAALGTTLPPAPDREQVAGKLIRASQDHSFDPMVDVDWEAPLAPAAYAEPPHRSSLYGTHLWDRLDQDRRVLLTRHEVASIASVGIWFETILLQMMARHIYNLDPRTAHVQYALTEVGDECRHSVMFARMIEKLGCPVYGPGRVAHAMGRVFKATSTGPLTFGAALFVEELLDSLQREAMRDETLEPLVRNVSRIHVIEESRHIRYARAELGRQWSRLSAPARETTRIQLAGAATVATRRLIHPRAYAAVGLDPRTAHRAAVRNPHWRGTLAWSARKVVDDFTGLGLIRGPARLLWNRAGLLDWVDGGDAAA
ncbi:MAG TPA: diiron oxygenase [Actinomycetota bacterium]|nr:diiron oxygenase [Actinomycetota bacterium]